MRKLGKLENTFEVHHRIGAHLVVNAVRVEGPLCAPLLEHALARLQRRHPLLGARIVPDAEGGLRFEGGTPAIPLTLTHRTGEDSWVAVVEKELCRPFDTATGPLCRVNFVLAADTPTSELVITFHHGIADGLASVRFVHDLLTACATPESAPVVPLPLVPPVEAMLGHRLGFAQKAAYLFKVLTAASRPVKVLCENPVPANERRTRLITACLSPERTAALTRRCRTQKTTIQGALCAAMAFATTASDEAASVSCTTPVDLRRFCGREDLEAQVGCFASAVETRHALGPTTLFWDLAQEAKAHIDRRIERAAPQESILIADWLVGELKLDRSVLARVPETNGGRTGTFLVSNRGRLLLEPAYGPFKIAAFYVGSGQHVMGPSFWLGALGFAGKLFLSFCYPSPVIGDETADALAAAVVSILERACEEDNLGRDLASLSVAFAGERV